MLINPNRLKISQQGVVYTDGEPITLQLIESKLAYLAMERRLQIAFKNGYYDNRRQFVDCLVVYHPAHLFDYFNFVVEIKQEGDAVNIFLYTYGKGKQSFKHNARNSMWNDFGRGNLSSAAIALVASLGYNKIKYAIESRYYSDLEQIFDELVD